MAEAAIHIVRAALRPKLYRDIEIPSNHFLYDLAEAIVRACTSRPATCPSGWLAPMPSGGSSAGPKSPTAAGSCGCG